MRVAWERRRSMGAHRLERAGKAHTHLLSLTQDIKTRTKEGKEGMNSLTLSRRSFVKAAAIAAVAASVPFASEPSDALA